MSINFGKIFLPILEQALFTGSQTALQSGNHQAGVDAAKNTLIMGSIQALLQYEMQLITQATTPAAAPVAPIAPANPTQAA